MNIAVARKWNTTEPTEVCKSPIHDFFEKHADALRNAARLLGGSEGTRIVEKIIDALCRDDHLSRRTIGLLLDLEDLLALEHVGDPDRAETGYFAAIDILDPVIEEVCLLTDALRGALAALPEHQPHLSTDRRGSDHFLLSRSPIADAIVVDGTGDAQ